MALTSIHVENPITIDCTTSLVEMSLDMIKSDYLIRLEYLVYLVYYQLVARYLNVLVVLRCADKTLTRFNKISSIWGHLTHQKIRRLWGSF